MAKHYTSRSWVRSLAGGPLLISLGAPGAAARVARTVAPVMAAIVLIMSSIPAVAAVDQGEVGRGPTVGLITARPEQAILSLSSSEATPEGARMILGWRSEPESSEAPRLAHRLAALGVTPWIELVLSTPAPLEEHLTELDEELLAVASLAEGMPPGAWFQIVWSPGGDGGAPENGSPAGMEKQYPYLLKRASAAIVGASSAAAVVPAAISADEQAIRRLYADEIATYVDALAVSPAPMDATERALAVIQELDPGRSVFLGPVSCPESGHALAAALAEGVSRGFVGLLFEQDGAVTDEDLDRVITAQKVIATELAGEVSVDPVLEIDGAAEAWAFVRAEDLGLRLVVQTRPGPADGLKLQIMDAALRGPARVDVLTGAVNDDVVNSRTRDGLEISIPDPSPVELIRLERLTAAELEGFEEEIEIFDERTPPVEEILRRLQAKEAGQDRALRHYQARNTTHLRFRSAAGVDAVQVSFEGDLFFDRRRGVDWTWESVRLNGVRWPGESIPEIPLVQPDKAAALPLVIDFTQEYRYELRGAETVDGRACWVVDFEPIEAARGAGLHKGRVWIDQELWVRVRSSAYQVGLQGMVTSNEETTTYSPLDQLGRPAQWNDAAVVLPTRVVGQMTQAILDATLLVEKEVLLTGVIINGESFEADRTRAHASGMTMVRDTEEGLRYLEPTEGAAERQVKEGFDPDHFFLLGGVFYDESVDFPMPLAGVDLFSMDLMGTGAQANVLFAGLFLDVNVAKNEIFETAWEAGLTANGVFLPLGDQLYRDGEEVEAEEIEQNGASVGMYAARSLGSFARVELGYDLGYERYGRADDTDDSFVIPSDTLTHAFRGELSLQRGGYSMALAASQHLRETWEPWGLPGNNEYDPDHDQYQRWRASAGKTFWMPGFMKLGVEVEYLGGENLDRFSRYDFGPFGGASVSGYPSGLVRASRAVGAHIDYGFNLGEIIQIGIDGDAMWVDDADTGLDNELLAGVGFGGTFIGPWETILNFEVGVPIAGPADGAVVRLVFLKQLDWSPFD